MSITVLPDGRVRAQVYNPTTGKNVSVGKVLGDPSSIYPDKRTAKIKREQARLLLERAGHEGPTLRAFAHRWTTDRLFEREKESTNRQLHWAIREFVGLYGGMPITKVGHQEVADYLMRGNRTGRIPALRAMFNDARSPKAGRLIQANPFERLGLTSSKGNRHSQPPSEKLVWEMIHKARELCGPGFSAWLQVACFTGMRPGELDALRWMNVDYVGGTIFVAEQFNSHTYSFTVPKNGRTREAILTDQARDALLRLPRENEFCFVTPRSTHFTPGARRRPWGKNRDAVGWDKSLYMATRHFAGWFMVNVLEQDSEDVAFALGHEDGGYQVRTRYGHRERRLGLERVRAAYARVPHNGRTIELEEVA